MTVEQKTLLFSEVGLDGGTYQKEQWRKIVSHTEDEVKGFFGHYRFLSNTYPATVYLDGVAFPSVENAYKAWRWKPTDRDYFRTCSPINAIKYNRERTPNGPTQEMWNLEKLRLMYLLNLFKYDKVLNPKLHALLLETGGKYLEETNWWGDAFWGKTKDGKGENNLGKIIMIIRQELQQSIG